MFLSRSSAKVAAATGRLRPRNWHSTRSAVGRSRTSTGLPVRPIPRSPDGAPISIWNEIMLQRKTSALSISNEFDSASVLKCRSRRVVTSSRICRPLSVRSGSAVPTIAAFGPVQIYIIEGHGLSRIVFLRWPCRAGGPVLAKKSAKARRIPGPNWPRRPPTTRWTASYVFPRRRFGESFPWRAKTSGDSSRGVSNDIFRRIQDSFTTQDLLPKAPRQLRPPPQIRRPGGATRTGHRR